MSTDVMEESAPFEVAEEDIAELLDMDDEEFLDVVSGAVRNAVGSVEHEEDWRCLFDPRVATRTRSTLNVFIGRARSMANDRRNTGLKRAEGRRLLLAAELRLAQSREQSAADRRLRALENMRNEDRAIREALRRLTLAVQAHRLAVVAEDAIMPADRELWRHLDEIQVDARGGPSLNEMIGSGVWFVGDSP